MNQLLHFYSAGCLTLNDAIATWLVDSMIDGRHFSSTVEELAAASHETLRRGRLHPQTIEMCAPQCEAEVLDFLRRIASDRRRPGPRPRFTRLDEAPWNRFDGRRPIARINRANHEIEGAIGYIELLTGGEAPGSSSHSVAALSSRCAPRPDHGRRRSACGCAMRATRQPSSKSS